MGNTKRSQRRLKTLKKVRLVIECDGMWSFVGNKENKKWLWFALDRDSREVVGLFVGGRDQSGAQGRWDSLPESYRESALAYTDFWKAYEKIFHKEQLYQYSKQSGATSHIERFNNTVQQRVSRLVRKTLSFSKKLENHIGAIWSFVYHYNQTLLLKNQPL